MNIGGFFKVGEESEIYFHLPHFRVGNIFFLFLWRRRVEKRTVTLKHGISCGATFLGLCFHESLLLLLPRNFRKTTSKIILISLQESNINLTYIIEEKLSV